MYTLHDLEAPIRITTRRMGFNLLENTIADAFHEQCPHACLDDLPYVEYNPDTKEIEVDDDFYEIDRELQAYLEEADKLFHTVPLPKIQIKTATLKITHPEINGEKGMIGIECINPPMY